MKILESQNAVLTNVEVYQFLTNQAKEYQESKRRGPGNLETLRRELLQYFEAHPNPLSQKPPAGLSGDPAAGIPALIRRLRRYQLTKGELVMMMNLRPTTIPALNTVIEDMEDRFTAEEQEDMVAGVVEVLGDFPPPPPEAEDEAE